MNDDAGIALVVVFGFVLLAAFFSALVSLILLLLGKTLFRRVEPWLKKSPNTSWWEDYYSQVDYSHVKVPPIEPPMAKEVTLHMHYEPDPTDYRKKIRVIDEVVQTGDVYVDWCTKQPWTSEGKTSSSKGPWPGGTRNT
jgi:hypothetical protein